MSCKIKISLVNISCENLENKLKNTGKIGEHTTLSLETVKEMLKEKFLSVDYESAKKDVSNFIDNKESLNLWKPELFLSSLQELNDC